MQVLALKKVRDIRQIQFYKYENNRHQTEDRIVKITVAGKVKEYEDGLTITQLIEKENVETPEYVTVSVNDEFVERADFENALKDGDEVEFLYFMGGGR